MVILGKRRVCKWVDMNGFFRNVCRLDYWFREIKKLKRKYESFITIPNPFNSMKNYYYCKITVKFVKT